MGEPKVNSEMACRAGTPAAAPELAHSKGTPRLVTFLALGLAAWTALCLAIEPEAALGFRDAAIHVHSR